MINKRAAYRALPKALQFEEAIKRIKNVQFCPKCHRAIEDGEEVNFMRKFGMCLSCDHIEGDSLGVSS